MNILAKNNSTKRRPSCKRSIGCHNTADMICFGCKEVPIWMHINLELLWRNAAKKKR